MKKDPIGKAILDFAQTGISKDIIVRSDLCDDDEMPSGYLFRSYDEMPKLEQLALSQCEGSILDVGAAAGCHTKHLQDVGKDVKAIDISRGAVEYMNSIGLNAELIDFYQESRTYDTLLLLMNVMGIAGRLSNLRTMLEKAKSLLNEGGKILCDSSDIRYLYQDDDGGMWVDLSSEYYGNFKFQKVNYTSSF